MLVLLIGCTYIQRVLTNAIFIILIIQCGTPISECTVINNTPYIIRLINSDDEMPPTHWVVVKQTPIVECRYIDSALFTFAYFYIVDVMFPQMAKDFFLSSSRKCFCSPQGTQKSQLFTTVFVLCWRVIHAELVIHWTVRQCTRGGSRNFRRGQTSSHTSQDMYILYEK